MPQDSVLDPGFEPGEEGVMVKLDVMEECEEVCPITILLLTGGNGDGVDLGCLRSQISS